MIHWYLFDVCFARFREPSLCTFIGFSLFVFLSRFFLRLPFFSPQYPLPTAAATVIMFCFYELWNCYWFYTTLLYISPTVLPQCLPRCESVSVFLICWLVFLFSCSVYLYYILFLYSIKHDYHHCSFCLYWFAFAFLQYQQHMVYFTSLFINTFLFSISHSASSFESDAILSRSLVFPHTVTTHAVKYVSVCVCERGKWDY